jgi:hypothetical protein
MPRGRGTKFCTFACDATDAEHCVAVLARHPYVDEAVSHEGGKLHYRIDLALLEEGDGPAAELRVTRDLERVVSRHRAPTDPPPDEVA